MFLLMVKEYNVQMIWQNKKIFLNPLDTLRGRCYDKYISRSGNPNIAEVLTRTLHDKYVLHIFSRGEKK
jgi:hypothetical protein